MQSQVEDEKTGTNCVDCERYRKFGDVCVMEHGKKFLWEFCKDFEAEVVLPDYKELMSTVRKDLAAERKKVKEKKKRERAAIKREKKLASKALEKSEGHSRETIVKPKVTPRRSNLKSPTLDPSLERSSVEKDKENRGNSGNKNKPRGKKHASSQAKMPRTASSARATA